MAHSFLANNLNNTDRKVKMKTSYQDKLLKCPKCGDTEKFQLTCTVLVNAENNEFTPAYETAEVNATDLCKCLKCGHMAFVACFKIKGKSKGDNNK